MNKSCAVCNPEERKKVATTKQFEPINVLNNACLKHQKVLEKLWQNAIGCLDKKLKQTQDTRHLPESVEAVLAAARIHEVSWIGPYPMQVCVIVISV